MAAIAGGRLLSGSKVFIANAGLADVIVVAAKTAPERGHHGISIFLVDRAAAGMSLGEPMAKLGWHASDTRKVAFDECFLAKRILGPV